MTSIASSSSSPAALLLAELSRSPLSDGSLQLLARLVGGPVEVRDAAPGPANRMRLISSISKAAAEADKTEPIEVDEAGWEVVGPTPLHTPPTSPLTAMRSLPNPRSATNRQAQTLSTSRSDDGSWAAPRWAPADHLSRTDVAPPTAMQIDAQPTLGDDWSAPPWATKATEEGRSEDWKAPRWARSPSPKTASRNEDAYVESWRAEAAPFHWSPPKVVLAKRPTSTDSQAVRRRAPQVAAQAEHWVPPSWAFVEA